MFNDQNGKPIMIERLRFSRRLEEFVGSLSPISVCRAMTMRDV